MTDLTKLADALELKGQSWQELKDREEACREAARILRAADGVDVAGLMAMSDTSIVLACDYLMTHKESAKAKAIEHRAALESALRMALAAREWQPIETAPKDGTDVIVMYMHIETQIVHNAFFMSEAEDCEPQDIGWWTYTHSEVSRELLNDWRTPTHWMPLPAAPKGTP